MEPQEVLDSNLCFILKATPHCNLRCVYCKEPMTTRRVSFNVEFIALLFDRVKKDATSNQVEFIWHGGEPLLLGLPFFKKVVFIQDRLIGSKKGCLNSIQTNATLIDDEWAAFFHAAHFNVGVSLDGPGSIQDTNRPMAGGGGSFAACIRGIDTLRKHEVNWGVLTVVSEPTLALGANELFEFFRMRSIGKFALLKLHRSWSSQEVGVEFHRRYGEFMTRMFQLYMELDDPTLTIREIVSKLNLFFGLGQSVCKDCGACVGHYFGIESDGGIWHCDKFFHDKRFYLGNIHKDSIQDIRDSSRLRDLVEYERALRARCAPCKWFYLCKGGCLADLLDYQRIEARPGTEDCGHFVLLEYMSQFFARSPRVIAFAERFLRAPADQESKHRGRAN